MAGRTKRGERRSAVVLGLGPLLLAGVQAVGCAGCTVTLRPRIEGVVLGQDRRPVPGARVESCSTERLITGPELEEQTNNMQRGCLQRDTVYTDKNGAFSLPKKTHRRASLFGENTESDHPSTALIVCAKDGAVGDAFINTFRHPDAIKLEIEVYQEPQDGGPGPRTAICQATLKAKGGR